MRVTFRGVRGSHPVSGRAFARYGHHTPCVSVAGGGRLVLFDAGSGAIAAGEALAGDPPAAIDLLLTHYHLDHLIGLPFFLLACPPTVPVRIFGPGGSDGEVAAAIGPLIGPPYFPVDPAPLAGRLECRALAGGTEMALARGWQLAAEALDHPGGVLGYRLVTPRGSLAYLTDLADQVEPDAVRRRLACDVDLLIHDAMFTRVEAEAHPDWGHASIEGALALARAAGARRLAGFHHHPRATDRDLREREKALRAAMPGALLAREGQSLTLPGRRREKALAPPRP